MGFTTKYTLPYPELTDSANVPRDQRALAEAVDAAMAGSSAGGLGVWVDCTASVRFCTDTSTAANTGQLINSARWMKIGKTVWYTGNGRVATVAVVNFALLLPSAAGVPLQPVGGQAGPPQAVVSNTEAVLGGWFMLADGARIVNMIGTSAAYSDAAANQQYRWSIVYEVV